MAHLPGWPLLCFEADGAAKDSPVELRDKGKLERERQRLASVRAAVAVDVKLLPLLYCVGGPFFAQHFVQLQNPSHLFLGVAFGHAFEKIVLLLSLDMCLQVEHFSYLQALLLHEAHRVRPVFRWLPNKARRAKAPGHLLGQFPLLCVPPSPPQHSGSHDFPRHPSPPTHGKDGFRLATGDASC